MTCIYKSWIIAGQKFKQKGGVCNENNFISATEEVKKNQLVLITLVAEEVLENLRTRSQETSHSFQMSAQTMDMKQEIMNIIQKVWIKLQALPQATPLEIGTFAVVILFMGQYKPLFEYH